jgi:hypothetical protein
LSTVLADFMNIRIEIDYENDTVQNVLDKVSRAVKSQRGGSRKSVTSAKSAETVSLRTPPRRLVDLYDELESELVERVGNTFYNKSPGILIGFIFTLILLNEQYIGTSVTRTTPLLEGGDANPMNEIIDYLQNVNNYLSYAMYDTPGEPALSVKAETMINDMIEYIRQPAEAPFANEVDMENILLKIRGKLARTHSDPMLQFKASYLYDMKVYPTITDIAVFKGECIQLLQRLNFICMSIKFEEKKELSPVKAGTKRRRISSPKDNYTRKNATVRNKNTA